MAKRKTRKKRRKRPPSGIYIKPANRGKLRKSAKAKKGKKIPVSQATCHEAEQEQEDQGQSELRLECSQVEEGRT